MESESQLLAANNQNPTISSPKSLGQTDVGLVRSVNQDSFYLDPHQRFFIVADGMGGHAGGQEASHIATQAIRAYLQEAWDEEIGSEELLEEAIYKANADILQDQYEHPERSDMGTTTVVVMFRRGQIYCAHIGDSRLYRLRGGNLEQITQDHTWVARAMEMGDISLEQARSHPWRHVLFQCLGRKDLTRVDIYPLEVQPQDLLLLCSDGLTEEVPDRTIATILQSGQTYQLLLESLIAAAKEAGGSDNITAVLIWDGSLGAGNPEEPAPQDKSIS